MKRWTAISPTVEDERYKLLAEYLRKKGVENEYVSWTGSTETVDNLDAFNEFYHVRLSSQIGVQALGAMKVQSSWATLLGVVDGMVQTRNGWWPLCSLHECFSQLIIQFGAGMDAHSGVFIVGAGGAARIAVAAFFKGGFNHFLLTNHKVEAGHATIEDIKRKFFGLKIDWVPKERIVLLPGENSVLVNSTPTTADNVLITELSYLNFLKRPGFLFDLNRTAKNSQLVQEAIETQVTVVGGVDIASRCDVIWAKWAFGVDLDLGSYSQDFLKILQS